MGFVLKASVEENYNLIFLIYYLLPRKLAWKQIYFHESVRGIKSYFKVSVEVTSVKASALPWKREASMEASMNFHLKCR